MESRPAIVENCRSRGVATADAMVSGLAPGRLAVTWIVGKSTFGRSLTGRSLYAAYPEDQDGHHDQCGHDRPADEKLRDIHYLLLSGLVFNFYLGTGDKPELTVGNDLFTGLQVPFR